MWDGDRVAKLPVRQFLLYLQHRTLLRTNLGSSLCKNLLSEAFLSFRLSSVSCSPQGELTAPTPSAPLRTTWLATRTGLAVICFSSGPSLPEPPPHHPGDTRPPLRTNN